MGRGMPGDLLLEIVSPKRINHVCPSELSGPDAADPQTTEVKAQISQEVLGEFPSAN